MRPRAWALAAALALGALAPARARAEKTPGAERPYDAPASDRRHPAPPELTPEYTSTEEQGIKLVYHLHARERAPALLRRALDIRSELAGILASDVLASIEIRIAAVPSHMAALAPPELPAGVPAVAFRDQRLIVMYLGSPLPQDTAELEQHLRHELAHLALDEALGGRDVPRWFHEGFAVHVSGEDGASRAEALCLAALRDRLLELRDVADRFPEGPHGGTLATAEAAEFLRYLIDARPRFAALVRELREGRKLEAALLAAYDGDMEHVEREFRRELARRYSFVPVLAGTTAIWVLVALAVGYRRRRLAAQRKEAATERRALGAAARLLAHDPPAPHLPAEEDELAQAMPRDPEVPKVEHDGRWYTLH